MPILILVILLILAYLGTRKVRVRVAKREKWRVELYFTLCKIRFHKSLFDQDKQEKKKQKSDDNKSKRRIIYKRIYDELRHVEIELDHLNVPALFVSSEPSKIFLSSIRQHATTCALLSLLNARAKKLTVKNNAITLCSDSESTFLDVSITARLFRIISTLALIWLDEKKMKRDLECQKIR